MIEIKLADENQKLLELNNLTKTSNNHEGYFYDHAKIQLNSDH